MTSADSPILDALEMPAELGLDKVILNNPVAACVM